MSIATSRSDLYTRNCELRLGDNKTRPYGLLFRFHLHCPFCLAIVVLLETILLVDLLNLQVNA
jgi:hypothetical protein